MKIITTLKKVASGLDFLTVTKAMGEGMANIGSYLQEELDSLKKESKFDEIPHIFMATHSMGVRRWKIAEGKESFYFLDEPTFNGGWYVFVDGDVTYLFMASASSGSSLTAEKQDDGTWTVTLEVPVEDGRPYEGCYWGCFHEALKEVEKKVVNEAVAA